MYNGSNKNCFEKSNSKATGELIGNRIADKITSVSKKSPTELHLMELHFKELKNGEINAEV